MEMCVRNGQILAPVIDPGLLLEISVDLFISDPDVIEAQELFARGLMSASVLADRLLYQRDLARTIAAQQIRAAFFFQSDEEVIH